MKVEPLGETALIIRGLAESPISAAKKFQQAFPNLTDVVPCYETVGLYFKDELPSVKALQEALKRPLGLVNSREHLIPVWYSLGTDSIRCASELGIPVEELIEIHSQKTYQCAAVGFTPGFAYLGDLDPRIAGLRRLASPRPTVEAGSVGITGKQTAVYPSSSPGGWNLIGQTPLTLVDLADDYFPIAAGDYVKFFAIENDEFERLKGERL